MDIYNIGTKINYMGAEAEVLKELAGDILKRSERAFESKRSSTFSVPRGVAVVPTGNDNSHSYPLNEAHVSVGGDEFLHNSNSRRTRGNYMTRNPRNIRCPTLEEIEIYLYDLFVNKKDSYVEIRAMHQ